MSSSSRKWGEYSSSSDEEEEIIFENTNVDVSEFKQFETVKEALDVCKCYSFLQTNEAINFLTKIPNEIDFNSEYYRCFLNNIVNISKFFVAEHKSLENKYRLAFVDIFYRIRHEILFKILCLSFNLDYTKSDISFRTIGINSDRTPDLIINNEDLKIIIEVSASSSLERAAASKGLEEAGFESKYKRELDELNDKGVSFIYIPFLFEMNSLGSKDYEGSLKKLGKYIKPNSFFTPIIKTVKNDFTLLTQQLRNYLMAPSSILFTKIEPMKRKHNELSFMYKIGQFDNKDENLNKKPFYKEICISGPVYNKIINNWHRLEEIIERSGKNNYITVFIDTTHHKILCIGGGKNTKEEYLDAILKEDKAKFFSMLKIKISGVLKPVTDSSDGIRYFVRTNYDNSNQNTENIIIDNFVNHVPSILNTESVDNSFYNKYEKLIDNYFSYKYVKKRDFSNFETDLINLISEKDLSVKKDFDENYSFKDVNLISMNSLDSINIESNFDSLKNLQVVKNKEMGELPLKIKKNKNPFILPIANITPAMHVSLSYKNLFLYKELLNKILYTDPFTAEILIKVLDDDFEFVRDKGIPSEAYNLMLSERVNISREMSFLYKEYYKSFNGKVKVKLSKTNDKYYQDKFLKLNNRMRLVCKEIEFKKKTENVCSETQLIRIPSKNKKTNLGQMFLKEMEHYKNKKLQSTIIGIGYRIGIDEDFSYDKATFDSITNWLSSYCGSNPVEIIDNFVGDDCKLLKDLKTRTLSEYENLINNVKDSNLGHASAFVSNLAHSLLYYSQMPFNSEYIRVDNLGLSNVLLIVRGGKKIFKSKSSKFFRLLYPVCEEILPWIETGYGEPSSTKIFDIDGMKYILTPWSQMNESVLNDSLSFYTRIVSFTILNLSPESFFSRDFSKLSFNVLLSFHNRRQTEVMLANLRYILLATLGDCTGIIDIFNEFLGFNYDCFQSYIRGCILKKYPDYFGKLKAVKNFKTKTPNYKDYVKMLPQNLFTDSFITTEEDLALMIYSTFLMTKAPYQRPTERARNLKGILDIHEYFCDNISKYDKDFTLEDFYNRTTVNIKNYKNLDDYSKKLFDNDFNYDPDYCSQVGAFADSYFLNRNLKEEIFTKWNSILDSCWDELSTSTGLRGKFDDLQNFWGQKGYFVVYKGLVNDKSYLNNLKLMFKSDLDSDSKRKMLRELNKTYKVEIEKEQEFLLFHAVDKVQWRGGREIYVMDIDTKTVQQPIEKFMGYLCSKLDNELISIPSDKRAQVIHHSIFEKDLPLSDVLTWYLTLDCSKWAPKSNYLKFIDTILSMDCLPPTFKTHFLNYCQKLFKKRIYFNSAEVFVLKNNSKFSDLIDKFLIFDKERNGYYMFMNYSWVMGIFNYTSSFLHAINQKYSSYIIFTTSLKSFNCETNLKMFAHSDDSGGKITCSNKFQMLRALALYEIQLKCCNHILSKKKSVISRFYFEILSVIYIFKKLLALLPKFLGGLRFLPSDKGPCHDMLDSYSKCIEVMVAGACFNVAYLVMKMYSKMIYRFYYHNRKSPSYNTPVQYFGMPDAHPLMVLLCGSESDILRLICNGSRDLLINQISFFNKITRTIEGDGPIRPIKFNIQVRGLKKGFEDVLKDFELECNNWSISNVNFHTTPMNFLSFLSKLKDSGFVGSLVNESTTRRLSRAYYMRKGKCISTVNGPMSIDDMMDILDSLNIINDPKKDSSVFPREIVLDLEKEIENLKENSELQLKVLETTLSSPLRVCRYMDEITMEGKVIIKSSRTLKPTHVELMKSPRTFSVVFDPAQMVSYIKEPEMSWALPNLRNIFSGKEEVISLCEDFGFKIENLDPSTLLKLCRNYSSKHKKEIYMYSQVPGEIRQIKTYSSFLTFLSTNTYSEKEIKGLVLRLKSNLTDPGYLPINIEEEVYMINGLISIIKTFLKISGRDFINNVDLKPIIMLNWKGGKIKDFLEHLFKISKDYEDSIHFMIQMCYLKDKLVDKFVSRTNASFISNSSYYYFPKSQKSKGGWFGKGVIIICVNKNVYEFKLYNNLVIELRSNCSGKLPKKDVSFILDAFTKSGLKINNNVSHENTEFLFGIDQNGDYSIVKRVEIKQGIPALGKEIIPTPSDRSELYEISESGSNSFFLTPGQGLGLSRFKIFTLPLMQGEILNQIRMLFDDKSFKSLVLEKGLNDFEDYVLTEIMTEFGFETYINYDEFYDNYQASELYKIFQKVKKDSISKLPNKISNSYLPASESGILRILLDYSRAVNKDIIKAPSKLSPELMEIRSQHPENVVAIMSEKLVECHKDIYNDSEIIEIQEAFESLYKYDNIESLEFNLIKLMTHWGYGALVNSLNNYTLAKSDQNIWYFSLDGIDKIESKIMTSVFVKLHKIICKSMFDHKDIYFSLNHIYQKVVEKKGVLKIIDDMNIEIIMGLYNFNYCMARKGLALIKFLNSFLSYLEDEDFLITLKMYTNKDYILCGIDFSYKNKEKIAALYNSLLYSFIRVNKKEYKIDYTKKVERLPNNVVQPLVMYKELSVDEIISQCPKLSVHYHGFLNDDLISFMKSSLSINAKGITYRVSQEISKPSKNSVPLTNILPLNHIYNEEVFDDENWDEVISTIAMGDAEYEDIEEYLDEIPNKFQKPRTRKIQGKLQVIQCLITWVIDPFTNNKTGCENFYRQCGENIIVVSTVLLNNFNFLPNTHVRLVNFSKVLKTNCRDMILYISCHKSLKMDFWDKYLGGVIFEKPTSDLFEKLCIDKFITQEKTIGHFTDRKKKHDDFFKKETEKNVLESNEKDVSATKNKNINNYLENIEDKIENLFKEGLISKRLKWRLLEKYSNPDLIETKGIEELFKNFLNEEKLRKFSSNIIEGKVALLTKKDHQKIFQSPEAFSMAYSHDHGYTGVVKDKKICAELNSINNNTASLIASDNLTISKSMYLNICNNYKLWVKIVRGCKYKRGNKKFILLKFLTLVNTAKVFDNNEHDNYWQNEININTGYFADDGPDDEDDELIMDIDDNLISASRLMYRASGF